MSRGAATCCRYGRAVRDVAGRKVGGRRAGVPYNAGRDATFHPRPGRPVAAAVLHVLRRGGDACRDVAAAGRGGDGGADGGEHRGVRDAGADAVCAGGRRPTLPCDALGAIGTAAGTAGVRNYGGGGCGGGAAGGGGGGGA